MQIDLVSLVVPCYNGERYLDKCFESIYKQTYSKLELIFVNDGSTDTSEQIFYLWKPKLENKGIIVKYIKKENGGLCSAINVGLKEVTGAYLKWPDCDDWMESDCIENEVFFLRNHPDFSAVRSRVSVVLENNLDTTVGYLLDKYTEKEYIFEELIDEKITVYPPIGWCVRSSCFWETHKKMEIYADNRGGQNYQMLLPIACKYKIGYIDKVLSHYLVRPQSLSHDKSKAIQNSRMHQKNCEMALRSCDIQNVESYIKRTNHRFTRTRFEYAVNNCDRETINSILKELSAFEKISFKQYFEIANSFRIVRFARKALGWIKRKLS